jgi:hypothetical protein
MVKPTGVKANVTLTLIGLLSRWELFPKPENFVESL